METVQVERGGGVVTVTLDRPHRKNAANATMWEELRTTFREIEANPDDRCVVITGAGGDFCSGADLTDGGAPSRDFLHGMRRIGDVCLAVHHLPQPVIAKVRGVAVGAGWNLALAADLVVAAEGARFSQIFAKRSLSLDFGGSWVLPRLVGMQVAKELALFGDILPAEAVQQLGLVNRVVPDGELDALVDDWARRLADGPTVALSLSKRLLNDGATSSLAQALEAEAMAQATNFGTADVAEAMRAFAEKRDPRFRGR